VRRCRCNGTLASVDAISVIAHQNGLKFNAASSVTTTPAAGGAPPNSRASALSPDDMDPDHERIAGANHAMS
jgi:hypothetical protein